MNITIPFPLSRRPESHPAELEILHQAGLVVGPVTQDQEGDYWTEVCKPALSGVQKEEH